MTGRTSVLDEPVSRTPRWAIAWADWAPFVAILISLTLAWLNYLTTARWAEVPGSLHGWRHPWYGAALTAVTVLALVNRRRLGTSVRLGRAACGLLLLAGIAVAVATFLARLPPSTWLQIPFKDDWTELYQQAINGVTLMQRGVVVGWNWWFLGGHPTSTDLSQNLGALAFIPMTLFGDRLGYHLLHVVMFLAVPVLVWGSLRREDGEVRWVATALAGVFAAGYSGTIASSGDTNSLAGVCTAGLAVMGGQAARRGRVWGGPVVLLGLTLALYSHTAFFLYALIYLTLDALYFRDRIAAVRLIAAAGIAGVAALPVYWESIRYPEYVSFNNVAYDPTAPVDWPTLFRTVYYNVEILFLPHRWFNDYRSLANIWLPAVAVVALSPGRSRTGYFAWAALLTQVLLRLNVAEAGATFDRIQHMLPLLMAPAMAGFVMHHTGARTLALSVIVTISLFIQMAMVPVRHVPDLRAFDPPLIDRIAASDGSLVLVEVSPHRDMDSDPNRRTPPTPFDVHFEGLLPTLAGQRFYSQMIDGWVFNSFRGQVVAGGTFAGRAIGETPIDAFVSEMQRWGVRHLFVWTDATRGYLAASPRFTERWRGGLWSHVELVDADVRAVVTRTGSARLSGLDFLGADVELTGVEAGEPVLVRMNYYPAWRAYAGDEEIRLTSANGQLAFAAPTTGTYVVRLVYPRYGWLVVASLAVFLVGCVALWIWHARFRESFALP